MIASVYLNKKLTLRAGSVLLNALRQILIPAFGLLISWIVLHNSEAGLWGTFVYFYAIVQITGNILDFGNKDLLLREISANPNLASFLWQNSLINRSFLLIIPVVWIAFLNATILIKLFLIAWILIRFVQQSFEVFFIYYKTFRLSVFAEITGISFIIFPALYLNERLDINKLILLFMVSSFVKLVITSWYFRAEIISKNTLQNSFDYKKFIRNSLPFFLLGFSGLLQSRADILVIKQYLTSEQLGHYQVFINLLFFAHAIPNFILLPFVKNIYRINNKTTYKIANKLLVFSPLPVLIALVFIYILIRYFYGMEWEIPVYLWAALFLFPAYFYTPYVYRFFRMKNQDRVIYINLFGFMLNILLNVLLLSLLGIEGAVISCAAAQWGILLGYILYLQLDKVREFKSLGV